MENYFWKIDDGRIWSSLQEAFVASVPDGLALTPLYENGRPGDIDYLRRTILFYGCGLGELAEKIALGEDEKK